MVKYTEPDAGGMFGTGNPLQTGAVQVDSGEQNGNLDGKHHPVFAACNIDNHALQMKESNFRGPEKPDMSGILKGKALHGNDLATLFHDLRRELTDELKSGSSLLLCRFCFK